MRVPPGVRQKDFSDTLVQFERVAGKEWVFTTDEDLDLYRDAYSPLWANPTSGWLPPPSRRTAPSRSNRSLALQTDERRAAVAAYRR